MIESIGGGWGGTLVGRLAVSDREALEAFLADVWASRECEVYPSKGQVFRALEMTPLVEVKAVIVGQDPYPTKGQACGLAFSVPQILPPRIRRPHSLGRILTELRREGYRAPKRATLEPWTDQGVLLLNSALTYSVDDAGHSRVWKPFTTAVIRALVERTDPIAFLLWGKHAQEWRDLIKTPHKAVCSPHPMARGRAAHFARSSPFSRANAALGDERKIDWSLG